MFLYDKTNILEGSGIFEVDFAPSHGPATVTVPIMNVMKKFLSTLKMIRVAYESSGLDAKTVVMF